MSLKCHSSTINMHSLLSLDCALFRSYIPVELCSIIKNYIVTPLLDDNIRHAVQLRLIDSEKAMTLYGKYEEWDTSKVTNMSYLFSHKRAVSRTLHVCYFNDNIEHWDVSNVITMEGIFQGCTKFNQPINRWNISKLKDMSYMFHQCHAFNQPLDNWDTNGVITMSGTFAHAHTFNCDIHEWNVSTVMTLRHMFEGAFSFNQPLNDWDVSEVSNMGEMFKYAYRFNQPLNRWNVSNVIVMVSMFEEAIAFNQPLDQWVPERVLLMNSMFKLAVSFNQSLNTWVISPDAIKQDMFRYAIAIDTAANVVWIADGHNNTINNQSCNNVLIYLYNKCVMCLVWIRSWDAVHSLYVRSEQISLFHTLDMLLPFIGYIIYSKALNSIRGYTHNKYSVIAALFTISVLLTIREGLRLLKMKL